MDSAGGAPPLRVPDGAAPDAASGPGARDVAWFARTGALAVGAAALVEVVAFAAGLFPRPAVPATLAVTAAALAIGWAVAARGRTWPAIWICVVAFALVAIVGSAVFSLMFVSILALPAATTLVTVPFLEGRRLWGMLAIVWGISIVGCTIGLIFHPPEGSDRAGTVAAVASLVYIAAIASYELVRVSQQFKRDRDAARTSEAQYRTLFEGSPVASFVFDPQSFRLLAVNRAAESMYGVGRDDLLRMTLPDLIDPPLHARFDALRDALLSDELVPLPRDWRHRRSDGTVLDVQGSSLMIPFEGRRARLSVLLDVS